jgi:GDP-mannose 6-dehydrogenase
MSRNLSVFGLGYVGTVTAACLAGKGQRVIGVDVNPAKVATLQGGRSPIVEPGIAELISEGHQSCRLQATTDATKAVMDSDISFVCVGTPSLQNGKLDLAHLRSVCQEIGTALKKKNSFHLIVLRSTVLPGTTETQLIPALEEASGQMQGRDFGVCVNPEFMREGSAVEDFLDPQITVIGAGDHSYSAMLRDLYDWVPGRVFETSIRAAEMLKYACNAWHAVKVTFANEIGTLAKELGVESDLLHDMFVADTRLNISSEYLRAGFAFGGSCLPKDVRAVNYRARELDLALPLLESILPSNAQHLERAVKLILKTGKQRIALLGLSFKAHTDDLRESPQVQLAKRLIGEGKQLKIWDENVSVGRLIGSNREYIEQVIPHLGTLLCPVLEDALQGAELVIVATRGIDRETLVRAIRQGQSMIDLVNLERERRPEGEGGYEGICW